MLLNNQLVNKEIKRETKKNPRQMKMEIQYTKLWDATKAVLRGIVLATNVYINLKKKDLK